MVGKRTLAGMLIVIRMLDIVYCWNDTRLCPGERRAAKNRGERLGLVPTLCGSLKRCEPLRFGFIDSWKFDQSTQTFQAPGTGRGTELVGDANTGIHSAP
jgi:hypothetical protein